MPNRSLATYRRKRDFAKTAEPEGSTKVTSTGALRFVIQKHAARRLHYDLRLEFGGVFKSWAVTKGPSLDPAVKRLAVEVEDHPLDYGDFEGTIPPGEYGGGTVQLWDRGYWRLEGAQSIENALRAGDLKFELLGERLTGSWVLVRMRHDRHNAKRTNWLLIKHRDSAARAQDADTVLAEDRSVASGRSLTQISAGEGHAPSPFMLSRQLRGAAKAVWHDSDVQAPSVPKAARARRAASTGLPVAKMPSFIEPQLAKLVDQPPGDQGWAHEVKFDGYRAQLRVERGVPTIRTRKGLDWTSKFSALATAAASLPDCIVDGEIVALDEAQLPSFAALQAALAEQKSAGLVFFAFDLLFARRKDFRQLALQDRKNRLRLLLGSEPGTPIRYVEHFESQGASLLQSACQMGLEGIISKRLQTPYTSGRSGGWLKAKCRAGHEVVLGGWTSEGGRLRSLLAGVHRNGDLIYVGRIGTGFSVAVASHLVPKLTAATRARSPFSGVNAPTKERNVSWLKPVLVAEIQFAGWTESGMLRQAAFKGLRLDKSAREVTAEVPTRISTLEKEPASRAPKPARLTRGKKATARAAAGHKRHNNVTRDLTDVPISKPDKVLWPQAGDGTPVTKIELAHYFTAVGEWLLPHILGRPCSLLRAPNGIGGQQFFQRHAMAGMSALFTLVKIKGDREAYVQIDRLEALAAVAQIAGLELHPWNCAPNNPEIAGRLVFDLDPAPDVSFEAVIAAALEIKSRLEAVGLNCFCKTTGGKGLHVVSPLTTGRQGLPWPPAKQFAHLLCAQMAQDSPARYLVTMSKRERKGRIFLDYLRNDRMSTAVAPLSPRARPGAPVSMPLTWHAVRKGLNPLAFDVHATPTLLRKSSAWDGYEHAAAPLEPAIRRLTSASR